MKNQATEIQSFLLKHIPDSPREIVTKTAKHFDVSRTTVLRHLGYLIADNKVIKTGTTSQVSYSLPSSLNKTFTFPITPEFEEYEIHTQYFDEFIQKHCNPNTQNICLYGITELLNNCKDHAQAKSVTVHLEISNDNIQLTFTDDGIGVFKSLEQVYDFENTRDTIFELSKGKLTRDPQNHSGEGIFFSSKAFDIFEICANGFKYIKDNLAKDWSLQEISKQKGSSIKCLIQRNSETQLVNIFKKYQGGEENLEFCKTDVTIKLADIHGDRLVSRSQAKRITRNLEKFKHVLLDFEKIEFVGQGFADQLFRVFQNQEPNIQLDYTNATDDVKFMIERARISPKTPKAPPNDYE